MRYTHNIDYKVSVPSEVPFFEIDGNELGDEILVEGVSLLNKATFDYLKNLAAKGTDLRWDEVDYNSVYDNEKRCYANEEVQSYSGWKNTDARYHAYFYWNVDIDSDYTLIMGLVLSAHFKRLIDSLQSPDDIGAELTFEYYSDSVTDSLYS